MGGGGGGARCESHLDLGSISNLISALFHLKLGATIGGGGGVISNIATASRCLVFLKLGSNCVGVGVANRLPV